MFRIARRVLGARKRANNAPPQSKNVPQAVPEQPTQPSAGFQNPFANMNSGQGTTNPFLLIAGSFVGIYAAFSLMNMVFGYRRVNARHVDQHGRPVDPRTGRPLAQWTILQIYRSWWNIYISWDIVHVLVDNITYYDAILNFLLFNAIFNFPKADILCRRHRSFWICFRIHLLALYDGRVRGDTVSNCSVQNVKW